jgi:hypothetical protein
MTLDDRIAKLEELLAVIPKEEWSTRSGPEGESWLITGSDPLAHFPYLTAQLRCYEGSFSPKHSQNAATVKALAELLALVLNYLPDLLKELRVGREFRDSAERPKGSHGMQCCDPRIDGELAALQAKCVALEKRIKAEMDSHDQPCYFCSEKISDTSANPGKWGIGLCHKDDPGVIKWHHEECVYQRLDERDSLKQQLSEAQATALETNRGYEATIKCRNDELADLRRQLSEKDAVIAGLQHALEMIPMLEKLSSFRSDMPRWVQACNIAKGALAALPDRKEE